MEIGFPPNPAAIREQSPEPDEFGQLITGCATRLVAAAIWQ
jgi:hypothetical protein